VVVVWGGGDAANNNDYNTGSRYDPATNTWTAMTTVGAPTGRRAPFGFWTGSRVLFYAGVDEDGVALGAPYLYDPVNNTWSNTTTTGRPGGLLDPTVGWTGSLLIVYGGRNGNSGNDETYTFEPAANDWNDVANGPSNRYGAMGTWDGSYLLAWSGYSFALRTDGRMYDPVLNTWTNMATTDDPAYRWAPRRQTGWSVRLKPRVTLMLGGTASPSVSTFMTDGGIYNSTTNAWTPVGAWPSGYSHMWGVGVWTGTEFVLWSGRTGTSTALTSTGERYFP
jgi:N-acetylneuraminic acid mutarotase